MPIYEYRCESCHRAFELLRTMEFAHAGAPCPSCGAASKKQLSVFSAFSRSEGGGESQSIGGGGGGCGAGGGCCGGACAN